MRITELSETQGSQLSAALMQGLNTLSENQEIEFVLYQQWILPGDGFVFFVRSDLLTSTPASEPVIHVQGSLHYDSNQTQNEDESIAVQNVVFTTNQEIAPFNQIESNTMYMGVFQNLTFSFTARSMYYKQSGIYHYFGDAVYPAMSTQIINTAQQLLDTSNVVSNSLPIWLAMNLIMPIYPAYLVPTNEIPPYAVVAVLPDSQEAMQSSPLIDINSNQNQLVMEKVKIVTYGLRNKTIMDYIKYVYEQSLNEFFGIMNSPIPVDMVRTQSEINVRGQKKEIIFEINYYQNVSRQIAQKLILSAMAIITDDSMILRDKYGNILYDVDGNMLISSGSTNLLNTLNKILYDNTGEILMDNTGSILTVS